MVAHQNPKLAYITNEMCHPNMLEIPIWLHIFTFWKIIYVSLQLCVQNAVSAQPCVGKFRISLVLLNFLHCNFRLWFETT